MHLIKVRVTKDALIAKDRLRAALESASSDLEVNGHRTPTDAIRCALSYKLREWITFEHNGKTCKALSATPRNVPRGKLHVEIHVQERDEKGVNYTANVATVTYDDETGAHVELGPDASNYENLIRALSLDNPTELIEFGQVHYFEPDVRRVFSVLTADATLRFWAGGLYVCLTPAQYQVTCRAAQVLQSLDAGRLTLRSVSLDDSEANKANVAASLGDDVFTPAFEALTERAERPGPHVEKLEEEYSELLDKIAEVEKWLGVSVDCAEAQEGFELALSALY